MKKFAIWFIVLAVCETIAIFVGQSLSSDAAAVLAGGFIGLVGALVAALVTSMVIEDRRYRELQRLSRQSRRRPEGLPWRQDVLEGEWRELSSTPSTPSTPFTNAIGNTNARMLPKPEAERALVVKR